MEGILNHEQIVKFEAHLRSEERSRATVEKYRHDIRVFWDFMKGRPPERAAILAYKEHLLASYAVTSANSMLAALNCFLRFCSHPELCVKRVRVQREAYCPAERELTRAEYMRLVETARRRGNMRLNLILQTICGSGIRVSELAFVTVEAVARGEAFVSCKGKTRRIFLVPELRRRLLLYIKAQHLTTGAVFITKGGRPVSRHHIWRDMKALCEEAHVPPCKVFPHNLRHLFARTFYSLEKDIAKLADILGHASIDTTRIYIITTGVEHKRKLEHMRLVV